MIGINKQLIFYAFLCILPLTGNAQEGSKEYLKEVLANLNKIKSAIYLCQSENWQPGDTLPLSVYQILCQEIDNPEDTTVGCVYTYGNPVQSGQIEFAYDGNQKFDFFHENKRVIVDDFTFRPLPFRLVNPPFFNFCKNILIYTFNTTDHIRYELKEKKDYYYFKLTIDEEEQVEFFGKAYHIPTPPFYVDPLSIYELWISKSNNLPYKLRRYMSHDISVKECIEAEFNTFSLKDFDVMKYIPKDYEIRTVEENKNQSKEKIKQGDLTGKPAPTWTLNNPDCQPVSLDDFKSEVLIICFTGIGCGPCQAAVPFLKEIKTHYYDEKVDIVAIESWSRRESVVKAYAERKQLNYTILTATDQIIQDYQTGGSAPQFFILDKQRIIRKTIKGYGGDRTNKEIISTIATLLETK